MMMRPPESPLPRSRWRHRSGEASCPGHEGPEALARRALEVDLDVVGREHRSPKARVIALPVSVPTARFTLRIGLRFSLACSWSRTERCVMKRQSSAASRPCSCFMLCRRWSAGTGFSNARGPGRWSDRPGTAPRVG